MIGPMNNRLVLGLSLAVAFLLGCVVTQAVAPTAPPAWAGAPGELQRWEYYCTKDPTKDKLDEAGRNGWELVAGAGAGNQAIMRFAWCFKRPRK